MTKLLQKISFRNMRRNMHRIFHFFANLTLRVCVSVFVSHGAASHAQKLPLSVALEKVLRPWRPPRKRSAKSG